MAARVNRMWILAAVAAVTAGVVAVVLVMSSGAKTSTSPPAPSASSSASAPKTATPTVPFPEVSNPAVSRAMISALESCFESDCLGSPSR